MTAHIFVIFLFIFASFKGGIASNDADASLTAFVVIAMQEGKEICAGSVGVSKHLPPLCFPELEWCQ